MKMFIGASREVPTYQAFFSMHHSMEPVDKETEIDTTLKWPFNSPYNASLYVGLADTGTSQSRFAARRNRMTEEQRAAETERLHVDCDIRDCCDVKVSFL
ncbi:hypothetical protein C5167_028755 [Papaver somniferum]|nr:hypothetical protein C5167_028755 [Papaver somniferum]